MSAPNGHTRLATPEKREACAPALSKKFVFESLYPLSSFQDEFYSVGEYPAAIHLRSSPQPLACDVLICDESCVMRAV